MLCVSVIMAEWSTNACRVVNKQAFLPDIQCTLMVLMLHDQPIVYIVLLTSTSVLPHTPCIHAVSTLLCCVTGTRVTHGAVCGSLLHLRLYVLYIGKGVLVQQRLSAMTSSVLLIGNVGTWKIVITVLTELHCQRLRGPHCELL